MVYDFFHKTRAIMYRESRKREEGHLIQVLQENGYPYEVVRFASKPQPSWPNKEQPTTPSTSPICIRPQCGSQKGLQEVQYRNCL